MIAIINSGGSGSRLWPLSTPEYPKHLLSISDDPEDRSLLQKTYDRVSSFADEVYFITEEGHAHHVRDQLPEVDDDHVIIEPARRGTASCLLLALDHVRERHDADAPLVFMHADHVINDVNAFQESVEHAAKTSLEEKAITMMGVEPTYPSTGFGYIEKGDRLSDADEKDSFKVSKFKEKPDRKTAESYLKAGSYLWNMGYFAAPLSVFIETMKRDAKDLHDGYDKLSQAEDKRESYLGLEDIAIDYALIEKASNLLVVPGNFDWMDVGNFQDLHTVASQDESGNAVAGDKIELEDVSNSLVRNKSGKNLVVIGLDNVAVVATKDGIVVTNRNMAQKVGDVSKRLRKKRSS